MLTGIEMARTSVSQRRRAIRETSGAEIEVRCAGTRRAEGDGGERGATEAKDEERETDASAMGKECVTWS